MLMADAVPGLDIGGKPQCRIVALAKEQAQSPPASAAR